MQSDVPADHQRQSCKTSSSRTHKKGPVSSSRRRVVQRPHPPLPACLVVILVDLRPLVVDGRGGFQFLGGRRRRRLLTANKVSGTSRERGQREQPVQTSDLATVLSFWSSNFSRAPTVESA
eukprot:322119-Hanusia_phi.AAC.10